MKRIIQKSLVITAIAATAPIVVASETFAQAAPTDATVNFTGTVGSVCTFSNIVSGTLALENLNTLQAGAPTASIGTPSGTAGSVDLDCTGSAELSVSTPQNNGSTTDLSTSPFAALNAFAEVGAVSGPGPFAFASNSSLSSPSTGFMPGPFDTTVTVGMSVSITTDIPEGAYNYNVVVTATPQ
ncbi:MAG: hypothetical protein AAFV90_13275 [Cyanobacteria bacterium J06634_5]